jgi:pimeloyl-ACP methyl ester carboxylesterase
VHGAWADASSWSGEVTTLQAAGYDVRAIANPLQDLTTDSEYIAGYLKTIHRPVVLAGHSYGGAVITNAAAGLATVKALVYIDASAPAPGETNGQLSGMTVQQASNRNRSIYCAGSSRIRTGRAVRAGPGVTWSAAAT